MRKKKREGWEKGKEQGRVAWDKPLSLVVGFQRKPAEKAEVNEIREQKWQSVAGWTVEGGV